MACGQKSVKNPKENLSKIINKQVLLSKGVICIKIRQIRVQKENEHESHELNEWKELGLLREKIWRRGDFPWMSNTQQDG